MRFYTKKKKTPVIIIVSLIDILAILLIFFIVTTTFKKEDGQVVMNLPKSSSAVDMPAEGAPLVVSVGGRDEIFLGNEPIALEELGARVEAALAENPDRPFALQGDEAAEFGVIIEVMDVLKKSGVERLPAFMEKKR